MAVRRESVRLDVEGNFARSMLEDAAAVEVLKRSLKDLSGTSVQTSRATRDLERDIASTAKSARQGARDLDTYSGRLGLLVSAIASMAPAVEPIAAVGIGGLAGLANDAGAAALAAGSLIVAFHGVGDAVKAANKAALQPTAANLEAAKLAMEQLSPAARHFVNEFRDMQPLLHQIQTAAASGWFPGLTRALHELQPLAPVIGKIFHDVGRVGGNLIAQGAKSLAGPQWRDFFAFIDTQAPKAMAALGHVVGSLAHGLAGLWMAFAPLNTSFNDWLVRSAKSFDVWANGLSKTQGFQDFIAYIHENGPKVADATEAIANALLAIVKAAAPLAGPTLDAITGIANAIAAIANSPLGTPIMMMVQLAGALSLLAKAGSALGSARGGLVDLPLLGRRLDAVLPSMTRFKAGAAEMRASLVELNTVGDLGASMTRFGRGLRGSLVEVGKAAAPVAALAVASSGVADKIGLANAVTLALAGSMAGPLGAAVGGATGAVIDFSKAVGESNDLLDRLHAAANSTDLSQVNQQLAAAQAAQADFLQHGNNPVSLIGNLFTDPTFRAGFVNSGFGNEIAALSVRSDELTRAQLGVSRSFSETAHAAGMTTAELAQLTAQTNAQKDAALGAFGANNSYRDALAAAEKQAKTNSAGIRGMSADARANSNSLAALAGSWNQNLEAMQANGASMHQMRSRAAEARDAFIKTAEAMGVPTRAAQVLADKLLHIPPKVNTHVQVTGVPEVLGEMDRLRRLIAGRPIVQSVVVRHVGDGGHNTSNPGQIISGYIGGTGSADGGTVPRTGLPYADRHPYLLADGEEVISNRYGQADRHRALLKAINANRMASGGTVGRSYAPSSSTVRHVIEVKVTGGELDLHSAKQQIHAIAREVSRDEIDQSDAFWNRRG